MKLPDHHSPIYAAWRDAAGDDWLKFVEHEFVRGLGDGSLPKAAFIEYLIQDYIYLLHYSRAWALVVVKSETPEQMRVAAATMNALINEEIQLHINVCLREGISEADLLNADEAPENIAYTRYVMDCGLGGDLLDLLAALAPCLYGYYEVGLRLADCHQTTALYREWIDTYNNDEYREVCDMTAKLIEEVAFAKLGDNPMQHPRWATLCKRFRIASQLEAGFWQMGLRLGQSK